MNSPKLLSNSVCFCGGDNGRFGRTDRTIFDDENSSRRTSLVAILSVVMNVKTIYLNVKKWFNAQRNSCGLWIRIIKLIFWDNLLWHFRKMLYSI